TNIFAINAILSISEVNKITILFAGLLIITGIGFKISMAPFHFWTPDVYEGAPITITALLSVASKAAGFALLIRFLKTTFVDITVTNFQSADWTIFEFFDWSTIIAVLSVLTMTLGNLAAIWQDNLKRMLAYSSIAHAGYMLMGLVILNNQGLIAILIYFIIYFFMNLGVFFVLMLLADKLNSEEIDDFKGIGYKASFLTVSMTIFLISLTGLPPTAGFIGKLYLFYALIQTKWIWLAVIGVINSVISLYYYIRVVKNMFLKDYENTEHIDFRISWANVVLVLIFLIPTLVFGIYFQPLIEYAQKSIALLGF
ncbi:MAG: NADH-quinone oxidoreductase subunit N, partial [Ignavibacteria bacterium]|nr:NADH-quinone oxidoreductase subunit N [Ignavibacteria bacterium]